MLRSSRIGFPCDALTVIAHMRYRGPRLWTGGGQRHEGVHSIDSQFPSTQTSSEAHWTHT